MRPRSPHHADGQERPTRRARRSSESRPSEEEESSASSQLTPSDEFHEALLTADGEYLFPRWDEERRTAVFPKELMVQQSWPADATQPLVCPSFLAPPPRRFVFSPATAASRPGV